jgi:hypothetical protein
VGTIGSSAMPQIGQAPGFLLEIIAVVAAIFYKVTPMDFTDLVAYAVQKVSVVRNHQKGQVEILKIGLEPFDDLDIQMICRFIKNQQIWLAKQKTHDGDPFLLTTGQLINGLLQISKTKCR